MGRDRSRGLRRGHQIYCVHSTDCGDAFTGVYICPNLSNCILKWCVLYYTSVMPPNMVIILMEANKASQICSVESHFGQFVRLPCCLACLPRLWNIAFWLQNDLGLSCPNSLSHLHLHPSKTNKQTRKKTNKKPTNAAKLIKTVLFYPWLVFLLAISFPLSCHFQRSRGLHSDYTSSCQRPKSWIFVS